MSKIRRHKDSEHHIEAHSMLYVLPRQCKPIDELLDIGHALKKPMNRRILLTILQNLRFAARQGLPVRGDGAESNSNFMQLLHLRAEDNPSIVEWLKRKNDTYTSKDIQNEMIQLMAHACLREIASELRSSSYLTVMADETTDSSNKEQLVIVFRHVDNELFAHEEFVGLYQLDKTDATTIVTAIRDVLLMLNLDIHRLRGQCYDGASTMSGLKSGVARQIQAEEPRAFYTHCYGHDLNLAVSDTIKNIPALKDAMDTTYQICKLIKYSPKRDGIFKRLKAEIHPGSPGVRVLCPTWWTVRAHSLKSVLDNYTVLQELWEESYDECKETEIKARIQGVAAQMRTFHFYYTASLAELVLCHTDNLSRALQKKTISAVEGQQIAEQVKKTLMSLRTDVHASTFWRSVTAKADRLDVSDPCLPHKRKRPARYEYGEAAPEFSETPEHHYTVTAYNQAIDVIVTCLEDRFDQQGYRVYSRLEQLLLKACKGESYTEELGIITEHYGADLSTDDLKVQLLTLSTNLDTSSDISLPDVLRFLRELPAAGRVLYSEVVKLVKLIVVMPASNATSERSFSALRRVKTYLRSTMTQVRLNNLMVLHIHRDKLDNLNLSQIGNQFIEAHDNRRSIFGHFEC